MSTRRRKLPGSPEVWARLVDGLDSKASEILSEVEDAHRLIGRIIGSRAESILGLGSQVDAYLYTEERVLGIPVTGVHGVPVAGVDSSITRPVRIGYRYYAAVSSAVILYPEGRAGEPLEEIHAYPRAAPDSADPPNAMRELTLEMFRAEAQALTRAARLLGGDGERGAILFLDGPIVDPPHFPAADGLREKYQRYVEARAKAVKRVLEAGGIVVGVVKRVSGAFFVEAMAGEVGEFKRLLEIGVGDYGFALYASIEFRRVLDSRRNTGDYALVFRAHELPDNGTDYKLYRDRGLRVYSFLLVPRLFGSRKERTPIRVEVALLEDNTSSLVEVVRRAAASIIAWLVPGTNIPEPVLLAHSKCSIRRREASTMLREIVTRSLYHAAKRRGAAEAELLLDFLLYP